MMKGASILKQNAANIENESVSWNLSWQPDGHCNSFTRESILACAPPTSGVYGLFNFDCQIFIGEAANIQEALLRHQSETDFQSRQMQPTGFTFEPCPLERCKPKVAELIAKYRPVLQTAAESMEPWPPSKAHIVTPASQNGLALETFSNYQEFPAKELEEPPKVRRAFRFTRKLGVALAAIFVASAVVIFYLGRPVDHAIQKRTVGTNANSGQTDLGLRSQNVPSKNSGGGLTNHDTDPTPAKRDADASSSNRKIPVRFDTKSNQAADQARIQKTTTLMTPSESANSSKKWSVQIAAAPAKDIADSLVEQLKAKGYDGYSVQAEVKGQTYYRVRVGHFDAREKAEALRQSLARQEGYRDAYLTSD
jgi:cell division septation protein DedD